MQVVVPQAYFTDKWIGDLHSAGEIAAKTGTCCVDQSRPLAQAESLHQCGRCLNHHLTARARPQVGNRRFVP